MSERGPISHQGFSPEWHYRRPPRRPNPFWIALMGALVGGLLMLLSIVYIAPVQDFLANLVPGSGLSGTPGGDGAGGGPRGTVNAQNSSPLPWDNNSVVEVVKHVGPSVVGIIRHQTVTDAWTGRTATVEAGYGSGVIIDRAGHIVTNYHVIENAAAIEVVLGDDQRVVKAELVAHDYPYSDLAVLKIDPAGLNLQPARFGDSSALQVGEAVVAIGNPKGLDFFRSATVGVISGIRSDLLQRLERESGNPASSRIFTLLQTDAAINRGNSGGPLVNLRGEVVGINTLKFTGSGTEGMGFALPSNEVRKIVADLIEHGRVIRPALGIAVVPEDLARSRYGITEGLLIEVDPTGPAAAAGLQNGDVILEFNGTPVNDFLVLLKEISKHNVGDTVTLKVVRDGQQMEVQVKLGELSSPARRN